MSWQKAPKPQGALESLYWLALRHPASGCPFSHTLNRRCGTRLPTVGSDSPRLYPIQSARNRLRSGTPGGRPWPLGVASSISLKHEPDDPPSKSGCGTTTDRIGKRSLTALTQYCLYPKGHGCPPPCALGAAGARREFREIKKINKREDCLSSRRLRVPQRPKFPSTTGSRNTGRISAKPQAHTVLATFDKTKVARRSQRRKLTPQSARQHEKTRHSKQAAKN